MGAFGVAAAAAAGLAWVFFLGNAAIILRSTPTAGQPSAAEAFHACVDFAPGPGSSPVSSSWTLDDCTEVWRRFAVAMPNLFQNRLPHVDLWRETTAELRRAGSPCLVASNPNFDGAGSVTIRHLAAWIYSEQMGCDWVTPDWGGRKVAMGNGTMAVAYCHRVATKQEMVTKQEMLLTKSADELLEENRCLVIDWLSYFQFGVPSVSLPETGTVVVENELRSSMEGMLAVREDIKNAGTLSRPWNRVVFTFHPSFASSLLANVGSWDEPKRQIVRRVLREARDNFHQHPRPWYNEHQACSFGTQRLQFAVHVRLGDRRAFQDGNVEYFRLLEILMSNIEEEVVGKGLPKPLFHIFSETVVPCPSQETGIFDEFPTWPVDKDQVPKCLAAPTPVDCPEKQAGYFCAPKRSGIFKVVGKNILLHVGADVQRALTCMIQADGVIMGCSTFGQLAGLFTKGISMFSTSCDGEMTAIQSKSIPPIAIAERGHLWVPIDGSWRDPALTSRAIFRTALDTHIAQRRTV